MRYETACRLAELHYTQICDGPTDDEHAVRVTEIERLLDEADRLSHLERSVRPVLLARPFGAQSLELSGHLEGLVAAAEDATRQDRYFHGAQLPIHSR